MELARDDGGMNPGIKRNQSQKGYEYAKEFKSGEGISSV
jgi:hypothetical protein